MIMVATTLRKAKRVLDAVSDGADVFSGEVDDVLLNYPDRAMSLGARYGSATYRKHKCKADERRRPAAESTPETA